MYHSVLSFDWKQKQWEIVVKLCDLKLYTRHQDRNFFYNAMFSICFWIHCMHISYRSSDRSIRVYHPEDLTNLLQREDLDVSPTILVPHYDEDSSTLFLTGRVSHVTWSWIGLAFCRDVRKVMDLLFSGRFQQYLFSNINFEIVACLTGLVIIQLVSTTQRFNKSVAKSKLRCITHYC